MKGRLARPRSIVWFERLFLTAVALRPLILHLEWDRYTAGFRASNPGLPAEFAFVSAGVGILIPLVLGWLVARRRSRIAAWIVLLWLMATLAAVVIQHADTGIAFGPATLLLALILLLAAVATVLLFVPESRRWFAGRPGLSDLERDFS